MEMIWISREVERKNREEEINIYEVDRQVNVKRLEWKSGETQFKK